MQPLSNKDYKALKRYIFIDALPKLQHYRPGQNGFRFSKDRASFVKPITLKAKRKGFILTSDERNQLRYEGSKGRSLEYYINTTVVEDLANPTLSRDIHKANWLHVDGFYPWEFGLNISSDKPNLFREKTRPEHKQTMCVSQE